MKYRIVEIEPNTPEHMEFRKGKIGASHAADIMGIGFTTPLQLWEEIVFDKQKPVTFAMQRGVELEPKARAWANDHLDVEFKPVIVQSIEHPWRIASLDGLFIRAEETIVLEIKCPGKQDHQIALNGEIPEKYVPQLQHQMDVVGVDGMIYLSFDGENGVMILVKKNEEYCKVILREEMSFKRRLDDFKPPEPIDKDYVEIVDSTKVLKAERWKELDDLIYDLQREQDQIKKELESDLPNDRCRLGNLKIEKRSRVGTVEYSKIPELQGVDLEQYRKPKSYWWQFTSC